jgi:hypothetical protein
MEVDNNPYNQVVSKDSPMKNWIIDYVGETEKPENDQVTVEMIVGVMVREFPEFVFALAEENFLRGYEQAFADMQSVTQDLAARESEQQNVEE